MVSSSMIMIRLGSVVLKSAYNDIWNMELEGPVG